jgi:hypothetical protein
MFLRQFRAVTINAFTITAGDPFYLILQLSALMLIALLGSLPGFTYGEHMRLYRDQCQALIFMISCLGITFGYIRTITDDLRRGAGSILLSRPIGANCLIFGKWAGVMCAIFLLHFSQMTAYLWISEVTFSPEYLQISSLMLYSAVIVGALGIGALRHYFFGGSFVFYTSLVLNVLMFLCLISRILMKGSAFFDWPGLESGLILIFGVIVFSSILLPVSVVSDAPLVLSLGIVVFFFGLISEYIINVAIHHELLVGICKSVVPNWQLFWVADKLGNGQHIPLTYYKACCIQSLLFTILCVIIATVLYDRMEIQGT